MNVSRIIKGPFFPEAIEVKNGESFGGEYLLLEGIGCQTNQYYERLFTQDELQSIVLVSSTEGTTEHQLTRSSSAKPISAPDVKTSRKTITKNEMRESTSYSVAS